MARPLGLGVVAEGIEDKAQLQEVRAFGCDVAQGFLLARPQPPVALASLLTLDAAVVAIAANVTG